MGDTALGTVMHLCCFGGCKSPAAERGARLNKITPWSIFPIDDAARFDAHNLTTFAGGYILPHNRI